MRIYAVADIHGRRERVEMIRRNVFKFKPDVLVVAGDIITFFGAGPVFDKLNDMSVPVLAIRGNSDPSGMERLMEKYPNISSLHLRQITVNGVSFAGASGTLPIPFRSRICLFEEQIIDKLEPLAENASVLVIHPPPYGTLDEVGGKFHAGSKGLNDFILRRQPELLICGHIHERPGAAFVGKTTVVNCSIGRTGQGAMIELDKGLKTNVNFL
jgi:Icc-related predicted phosphoesterase